MNLQNFENHVAQIKLLILTIDQMDMLDIQDRANLIVEALGIYKEKHLQPDFPKCSFTLSCDYLQRNPKAQLKVSLKSRASIVDIKTNLHTKE